MPATMDLVDPHYVPSWGVEDPSGEELITYVEEALKKGARFYIEKPFEIKEIKASIGKYSILGNHDYGDYVQWNSKIEKYVNGLNYNDFSNNEMVIDAVIRNFEVIGEAANNIPENIRNKHTR